MHPSSEVLTNKLTKRSPWSRYLLEKQVLRQTVK